MTRRPGLLDALVTARRLAEERAERVLAEVGAAARREEATQAVLERAALAARDRMAVALKTPAGEPELATAVTAERFKDRRRTEAATAREAARAHRTGPLALALEREGEARAQHQAAHGDREAAERLQGRAAAAERRVAERRAEDVASDLAAARQRLDRPEGAG